MNTTVAKVISYILQPLAMPFFTFLLAFNVDPYLDAYLNPAAKNAVYSVIGLNTFLVPTMMVVYLKRLKIISNLDVSIRRERFVPFLITLVIYVITYIFLRRSPLPDIIFSILLGSILAMIAAFIITLFWKISIHMTGIGGVIGAMSALFDIHLFFPAGILCALVLVAGFIGTARMYLGIHTLSQVIAGTFLGFFFQFFVVRMGLIV